jgi:hypothetical protein
MTGHDIFKEVGIATANLILFVKHGPEVFKTIKEWLGFAQDIERRIGDRRHIMSISFAEVVKAVELAPQLAPDIEKTVTDVKQVLSDIQALESKIQGVLAMAPTPPAA